MKAAKVPAGERATAQTAEPTVLRWVVSVLLALGVLARSGDAPTSRRSSEPPVSIEAAHRVTVVAVAVLAVVGLTACSPREPEMTPNDAREALISTTQETADLLDVDGWTAEGAPLAEGCGSGEENVKWSYFYGASLIDGDLDAMVSTVAEHWRSLGMEVRTQTAPVPAVFATGGSLQGLAFTAGPSNFTISGTSLCASGDPDEYR